MHTTEWEIRLYLAEDDDHTHAKATLRTRDGESLHAEGSARRNPADALVPEIGEELAVARALHALAARLTDAAVADIAGMTQRV